MAWNAAEMGTIPKLKKMQQTAKASTMRSINTAAILNVIRHHGPLGRSQIAKLLNVSLPTVMRIVDGLIEEDLVRVHAESEPTGGRPRSLLEFNGSAYAVVGVDLGGTKMLGALADLQGTVQHEIRIPLNGCSGLESVEHLCQLIQELLDAPRPAGQRIRGIGIGAPGVTLNEEGVVTWAPSLGWRDLPLKSMLSERFGIPVFVENDVNLAALGEMEYGAGRGVRNLVCVAIGTGIGAGIIIDGTLYRGHDQAAGEIGYVVPGVEFLDRRYDQFGALESLASGTGIAERARELLQQRNLPSPRGDLNAEDVFQAARHGEIWAQEIVSETVDFLALSIANISALLNPEIIVLSGGVVRSADLLIAPILRRLEGVVPFVPRLLASPLGYRSIIMGAIMLVLNTTSEHLMVKQLP